MKVLYEVLVLWYKGYGTVMGRVGGCLGGWWIEKYTFYEACHHR